jgi:uncharacterized iron-regulated membrane protein
MRVGVKSGRRTWTVKIRSDEQEWYSGRKLSLGVGWHTRLRRLILSVHLSVGLIGGVFILVLGLTGSVMVFEPELDRAIHPHLSYVKPGGSPLSLTEIGAAVSKQFNGEPIVAYLPSESADLASKVIMPRGIVSVNQYTGEVLGTRTRGQTIFGLARDLHVRFASGDVGRTIMRWSGVALLVSLTSGLYLWWPNRRIGIRGGWRSVRFWFDLHNSVGILSLAPLLVLAVTGTVTGFEDQAGFVLRKVTEARLVSGRQNVDRGQFAPGAQVITLEVITPDQAVAIARAQMPGAIPYRVQMPRYGGAYRVNLDFPRDRVAGGRNLVAIDPSSGSVIFTTRSTELSSSERILAINEAIHTGEVLGMPSRILAWLTCIVVPVQVISGLMLWLRRKRRARS